MDAAQSMRFSGAMDMSFSVGDAPKAMNIPMSGTYQAPDRMQMQMQMPDIGTSMEIQLLGGAGASSIAIMINDVLRVVNFPLAFAIATVVSILLIVAIIVADRTLKLSPLFEDRGA